MRADIREMELCLYSFKKDIKGKQISKKMNLLLAELETHLQLVIAQAEIEGDLHEQRINQEMLEIYKCK